MKKRGKKSQATALIIIAILVALGIGTTSYVIGENRRAAAEEFFSQSNIKPELESIQTQILSCAETTSKEAIDLIFLQGGYYKSEPKYKFSADFFVPFYYYEGEILRPNRKFIQDELSDYVNDNLNNCLAQISLPNFQINYNRPITKSVIEPGLVSFKIDQTSTLEREGHKIEFDLIDKVITHTSELDAIFELAIFITDSHLYDPELYCISCVAELAQRNDLYVDIMNFRPNEMLILISENHTASDPKTFEFLNKYKGDELSPFYQVDTFIEPPFPETPKDLI